MISRLSSDNHGPHSSADELRPATRVGALNGEQLEGATSEPAPPGPLPSGPDPCGLASKPSRPHAALVARTASARGNTAAILSTYGSLETRICLSHPRGLAARQRER